MATTYTYPGVYVEEIPSGVHTIVGVATSNSAFVDYFTRGPMNTAVQLTSYADFERQFGGLNLNSEASYAIQQYYLNGGQIAWVIRVAGGTPGPASLDLAGGSPAQTSLTVQAASEGNWGNSLQVAVNYATRDPVNFPNEFNLVVREAPTVNGRQQVVAYEVHRNLSMRQNDPTVNYAPDVVNNDSTLITLQDAGLGNAPAATQAGTTDVTNPTIITNPASKGFAPLNQTGSDGSLPDANALLGNDASGKQVPYHGIFALDKIEPEIFNVLCLPVTANFTAGADTVLSTAREYCATKRAFLIVDIPKTVTTPAQMIAALPADTSNNDHAAVYFPRLNVPDPLNGFRPRDVGASGTMAGIYARTDATRGVWKAPAGTEATLTNVQSLTVTLNDLENGELNPLGVNVLRTFPIYGIVSWGARTMAGADQLASEWKYIPVRRTAMFIEESLYRGLKWVVFEPNDEPLWSLIRLNVGAFMHDLFRQGAFQGTTPQDAYFVKCDKDTTTQNDINLGIVNILVGFAPLKPAEFVVIKIQQMAGQIQT